MDYPEYVEVLYGDYPLGHPYLPDQTQVQSLEVSRGRNDLVALILVRVHDAELELVAGFVLDDHDWAMQVVATQMSKSWPERQIRTTGPMRILPAFPTPRSTSGPSLPIPE